MRRPLQDLCTLITDGTHYTPPDVGEGVPFLTVKDVSEEGLDFRGCSRISETDFAAARAGNSAPRQGDVLFSKDGTVGKVHVVQTDQDFAVLSSLAILRPDQNWIDAGYLGHMLRTPDVVGQATRRTTGSAIRRIVLKDLREVEIGVPPVDEQRRIARMLDQADVLRAKRRQALAHVKNLSGSIFEEMFGGSTWVEERLADVVREGTLVTYGIVQAGPEVADGVPYVRTGDIVDGRIVPEGLRRTDPAIAAKFARSTVRAGDIVMSIRATVGTTAVVPEILDGANLTQGTARIAPGLRALGPYLLAYLRSDRAQRWIQAQVKGATFREITLGRLRDLSVPLPPNDLQEVFSARVAQVEALWRSCQKAAIDEHALFLSLQSRAFRGEL